MTRVLLSLFVSLTALAVGLASSWMQSENHELGKRLDAMMRDGDLERAGNEGLAAEVMALRFGFDLDQLDGEEHDPESRDERPDDLAEVTE